MKIFFKTLFIFLCFIFFQGSFANNVPADIFTSENYIQNHHENIVLTSETMRGLEIFSQEGDANQQFSQGRFLGTYSNQNADNIYLDNNSEIAGENIHNLSTCFKSEILIRAP